MYTALQWCSHYDTFNYHVHVLDQGNVTRANVADVYVEINSNASRLVFRENVTENTLWSGIQSV
jgi:hypothetical protein